MIDNRFGEEIGRFHEWRTTLSKAVREYHDWLEDTKQLDVKQSIRFYDLLETINRGRMLLAFLAEYSRGKSELINALFFSSLGERLLPSDVGRTTMCPTELFHDPDEEPYLKLLSVETRYRDESISQLKSMPVEWSKIRLKVDDPVQMKQALSSLADSKKVYGLDARMMGLVPMFDETGEFKEDALVEIPSWRYAMINYPHPLLTAGLSVLDTPGLNALGLEPELTLATLPGAQAVLFLLSIDTGVTKSDLEIWERYVKTAHPAKIAVLNKIDLMWDELKSAADIRAGVDRMVDNTAQSLGLPKNKVFAISAKKALIGRIKNDAPLIEQSGIVTLENYLADHIIPAKRSILARAVTNEIGAMLMASHRSCSQKLEANVAQLRDLREVVGKSRDMSGKLWQKISAEKEAYAAALAEYKVQRAQFNKRQADLMQALSSTRLDQLCTESMQTINDAWTTVTLTRGMRKLVELVRTEFETAHKAGADILAFMENVYNVFHEGFHFAKMDMPPLNLEGASNKLQLLIYETEKFCKDPVNIVATEKSFMIKRFWRSLVGEARKVFDEARRDSERWLVAVPLPLETQMRDHKAQLESRLAMLSKINERGGAIKEELAKLEAERKALESQLGLVTGLIKQVREAAKVVDSPVNAGVEPVA